MDLDLQIIFDALLEGVIVLDERDRIEFLNPEATQLLGLSGESHHHETLAFILGVSHPLNVIVEGVRQSGRAAIYDEIEFPRRLETPLPTDVSVSLLGDEEDAGRKVAIGLRDRSTAQTLREEVSERERQESYGHIAAGIAHEVKNPLGGIRGAAELLQASAPTERSQRTAELIVREVDRISGLVDELMIFARGDELALESVNVHRPLDALLDLLALESGYEHIEIRRQYDPSLPELTADPARLQQIFLNLARNAMQAMEDVPEGGCLTLTTRMSLANRLIGHDGRPKPTLAVTVTDNGTGIPESMQHRLATPFFTTKRKGTGLGLSVARHWVRRHNGRLRIESVEGEGTQISVYLPLTPLPYVDDAPRYAPLAPTESPS